MKTKPVTIYKRTATAQQLFYFTERARQIITATTPEMVIVANGIFDGKRTITADGRRFNVEPRTDWVKEAVTATV